MPFSTDYCASKTALLSLAETLLHELRAAGSEIGVSVATPSFTQSNLANGLTGEIAEQFKLFARSRALTGDELSVGHWFLDTKGKSNAKVARQGP